MVNAIEVKNPRPVDPSRDEESEYNTRKPLRFGSRTSCNHRRVTGNNRFDCAKTHLLTS